MDIITKLNLTFLIILALCALFIKIRSEYGEEPVFLVRAVIVITLTSSFIGFIITALLRIWL